MAADGKHTPEFSSQDALLERQLDGLRGELRALGARLKSAAIMNDVNELLKLLDERRALHEQFKAYIERVVPDEHITHERWHEFLDELWVMEWNMQTALQVARREHELAMVKDPAALEFERLVVEPGLWLATDQDVRRETLIGAVDKRLSTSELRAVVADVRQFQQHISEYRALLIAEGLLPDEQPVTSSDVAPVEAKTMRLERPVFEAEANFAAYLSSDIARAMVSETAVAERAKLSVKQPRKRTPRVEVVSVAAPTPELEEQPVMTADLKVIGALKRVKRWFLEFTGVEGEHEQVEQEGGDEAFNKTEVTLRVAGGLLSVLAPEIGARSLENIPRRLMQERVVEDEHGRLYESAQRIIAQEKQGGDEFARRREAHVEAAARFERTLETSTYLLDAHKKDLSHRLVVLRDQYLENSAENDRARDQEIATVVGDAVYARTASDAVARDAAHTALAGLGLYAFRGPAYGALDLVERTKRVADKEGSLSFIEPMRQAFTHAFRAGHEREAVRPQSTSISEALKTIGALVGESSSTYGMLEQAVPTLEKLSHENWEMQQLATEAVLRLQERIDSYLAGYEPTDGHRGVWRGIMPTLPEDARLLNRDTLRFATVRSGDGLTQVLARQIERTPEHFGYDGEGDVHLFAVKQALRIAKVDGIEDRWLRLRDSAGQVALVPELRHGVVHAIFRDTATGQEIAPGELHERGVVMSASAA